jgi:hypothetical protein
MTVGSPTSFTGAVTLGDAAGDAISILGTATFTPLATFTGGLTSTGTGTFNGALVANGNTTLGNAAGDTVTVTGTATFTPLATFTGGLTSVALGTFQAGVTLSGGSLTFSGTAQRILGDFSNGTLANRPHIQTSVTNGATVVGILPNGTEVNAGVIAHAGTNPDATSYGLLLANTTAVSVQAGRTGGAAYLPLQFHTNATNQLEIAANGDIKIGSSTSLKIGFFGDAGAVQPAAGAAATDPATTQTLANALRTGLRALGLFS